MKDPMLRSEIVEVVRAAMSEVMEQMEERWVTPKELSQQFAFFTKSWLEDFGHLLPRERVEVVGGGVDASTHWSYPVHKINRMVSEGKFRMLEYKEAMKKRVGHVASHRSKDGSDEVGEHGGETSMRKDGKTGIDNENCHCGETARHAGI